MKHECKNKDYREYLNSVLELLEKGYPSYYWEGKHLYGLCAISGNAKTYLRRQDGTPYEWDCVYRLRESIAELKRSNKVFYDVYGDETDNRTQFIWHPTDKTSRIDFINKLINELK